MKKKFICKIVIDMIMTVLLLFLMARQLTGDLIHEWLGAGMLILWIVHHILNRSWYSHLFKGKYMSERILQTVTNSAVLLSMLGLMVSGIILSREVFAFLPISGGIALARPLHVLSAFWGYVLMALHLGLHWNMIPEHQQLFSVFHSYRITTFLHKNQSGSFWNLMPHSS